MNGTKKNIVYKDSNVKARAASAVELQLLQDLSSVILLLGIIGIIISILILVG